MSEIKPKVKNKKLIFWLRMIGWIIFDVCIPIAAIAIKFGLFKQDGYEIVRDDLGNITSMRIALSAWGIIAVVILACAVNKVINELIASSNNGFALSKQILQGIKATIIPLVIIFGITFWLDGVILQVRECLLIIIISKTIALILDPLPEWRFLKTGKENYSSILNDISNSIKKLVSKGGDS